MVFSFTQYSESTFVLVLTSDTSALLPLLFKLISYGGTGNGTVIFRPQGNPAP